MSVWIGFSSQIEISPSQANASSNVWRVLNIYVEKRNAAKFATAPKKSFLNNAIRIKNCRITRKQESVKVEGKYMAARRRIYCREIRTRLKLYVHTMWLSWHDGHLGKLVSRIWRLYKVLHTQVTRSQQIHRTIDTCTAVTIDLLRLMELCLSNRKESG